MIILLHGHQLSQAVIFSSAKEIVVEALIHCAKETMHDAREAEKKAAVQQDPLSLIVCSAGQKLIEIILSIDMGWNKRSSSRHYNSPSGVLYMLGCIFGQMLKAAVMI